MNNTNIIVTGGSGFVGSHLVKHLSEKHSVTNYDIADGNDILDFDNLRNTFNEVHPHQVYHLAGSVHMPPAEKNPLKDYTLNIQGTLNIIKLCEEHNAKLLFTGTGASYGIGDYPQQEEVYPKPVSNYGISKLAAEMYIRKWAWTTKLHGVVTRYSSVYGPNRSAGPVNLMLRNALTKGWIRVDGAGHHTRDFVNIEDAVKGTTLVMEKGVSGELYNVGSGVETSIVEVAWIIHELTGAEIRHVPCEYSLFDLPRSCYDITKTKQLGYQPETTLKQGIEELLKHEEYLLGHK